MENNLASTAQVQKIHYLIGKLGWITDKANLIRTASDGRTEQSTKLYFEEARHLLIQLAEYDPLERIKSLIFSLSYRAGIIYGFTGEDKKINAAKLNLFLEKRGAVKKHLNAMTYPELIKTHRQFEAIVKNQQKTSDNKAAGAAVRHMLDELNLTTA